MNGSGNLKNQGTLLLGLFVLFVLFCFHTLPHPRKELKQFSIGMFPAEKCFEGRKKSKKLRKKTMINEHKQSTEGKGVEYSDWTDWLRWSQ